MTIRADTGLMRELAAYGSGDIDACFNCGNCTAICPLSKDDAPFPRRMIRMAQVGLRDELLASKELWMCYYCGECTTTCPRQAGPAGFMAAARRYAISSYDGLGLGKLLHRRPWVALAVLVLIAFLLAGFMYSQHEVPPQNRLALFEFIPAELIHDLGLAIIVFVALWGAWGIANMVRHQVRAAGLQRGVRYNWVGAFVETAVQEALAHKRYRACCEENMDPPPWYLKKWLIHATIMWGFLGLLAATMLDWGTALLGIKETGAWVPIYSPIRLLGTVSGILLLYGTTVSIIKRLRKTDRQTEDSTLDDWFFLALLWLAGLTGFAVEAAIYLPPPQSWAYWMLLVHVAISIEVCLLLPFTKFAHVLYRTVALYLHALKPVPQEEAAPAAAAPD